MTTQIRADELVRLLRPEFGNASAGSGGGTSLTEGPGIDIDSHAIGIGGDTILIYHANGNPTNEEPATEAGLIAALAATNAGDAIEWPDIIIDVTAPVTLPDDISLIGCSNVSSGLRATVDIGEHLLKSGGGCTIKNLAIAYTGANSVNARYGLWGTGTVAKRTYIINCTSTCYNASSGRTNGIRLDGYSEAMGCWGFASGVGASAIGIETATGGFPTATQCAGKADGANAGGINIGIYCDTVGIINGCSGSAEDSPVNIGIELVGMVDARHVTVSSIGAAVDNTAYGWVIAAGDGYVSGGYATGTTFDLRVPAGGTAHLYALRYSTSSINGTVVYDRGDRAAYSVEDYHATDIEAAALTRHLPAPITIGDMAIVNAASNWAILPDVAVGQPLLSGGVATVPAYAGWYMTGTAGQTYTLPAVGGTIPVGTGVVGRVAEWVTNANTLQAANLIAPAANILTLTATAASTLGIAITAGKILTLTTIDDRNLTAEITGAVIVRSITPNIVGGAFGGTPGNARGASAVDLQQSRANATEVASASYSVIAGGYTNTASALGSVIGGGIANVASANYAVVVGGYTNVSSGINATIIGGSLGTASGLNATVCGGLSNVAAGDYSVACGRRAIIAAAHDGSFLFADGTDADFNSVAANEFAIRAIFRVAYDDAHYCTATVAATGVTTFATLPVGEGFVFTPPVTFTDALTANGAVTLGNAAADDITVNGTLHSNLIFHDATYDIGASGATRPRDLYLSRNIIMADGATIGQAAGPLVAFDDTNNYLEITGCNVGIETTGPTAYAGYTTLALANATNGGVLDFMTGATVNGQVFNSASAFFAGSQTDIPFFLRTNSLTRMTILNTSGNVGIQDTAPDHILECVITSATDPIADAWTTHPCDRTTKTIIGDCPLLMDNFAKIPLYQWRRKPIVHENEIDALYDAYVDEMEKAQQPIADAKTWKGRKRIELEAAKAALPKFNVTRIGIMTDDESVPDEICNPDSDGGLDLVGYIGYLHAVVREMAGRVQMLEKSGE